MGGGTAGGGGSGGAPPRTIRGGRRPVLCCASRDKTITGAAGQHVNGDELEDVGQQLLLRLRRAISIVPEMRLPLIDAVCVSGTRRGAHPTSFNAELLRSNMSKVRTEGRRNISDHIHNGQAVHRSGSCLEASRMWPKE